MRIPILLCLALVWHHSYAQPKPANIFSSHMVLQRDKPIHVWGSATAGEMITVTLADKSAKTKTDRNGQWSVTLAPMPHGGPHTLRIRGKEETILDDILIGEVWVCSGQSNMEWPLKLTDDADKRISEANNAMIRHVKVPLTTSLTAMADIPATQWQVCSPQTAADFTAVGYHFARKLWDDMHIPVGLVNSSWGGTHVETWISGESFFAEPEFEAWKAAMPKNADSILASKEARIREIVARNQPILPSPAEAAGFRNAGLDDASWKTMELPGAWENKGMPEIDGVVWFRRSFQVPAGLRIDNPVLHLAMIDDADSVFINGEFVGSTNAYNTPRKYPIKAGLLKSVNTISVRVLDTGGDGGMYGSADDMHITIGDMRIPLAGAWRYRIATVSAASGSLGPNTYPTLLYNAMIHPIQQLPVRGVIWYQGESNAGRAEQYRRSFPLMIRDWRKQWRDTLPFYFVQLTHWKAGGGNSRNGGSTWAELREAQQMTLRLPHTGMAVITDIGNTEDIHPRNKADVGYRLALQALAKTYGKAQPCESPVFAGMDRQGQSLLLRFDHLYGGWEVRNPYGYINGFEVAGADRKFYLARAWLRRDRIVVESDQVAEPVAVRYCWSDDPNDVNLFNKVGLPCAPFRSDDWPMRTMGAGFRPGQ